jgi:hypothetical protein
MKNTRGGERCAGMRTTLAPFSTGTEQDVIRAARAWPCIIMAEGSIGRSDTPSMSIVFDCMSMRRWIFEMRFCCIIVIIVIMLPLKLPRKSLNFRLPPHRASVMVIFRCQIFVYLHLHIFVMKWWILRPSLNLYMVDNHTIHRQQYLSRRQICRYNRKLLSLLKSILVVVICANVNVAKPQATWFA